MTQKERQEATRLIEKSRVVMRVVHLSRKLKTMGADHEAKVLHVLARAVWTDRQESFAAACNRWEQEIPTPEKEQP